MLSHLTLLHTQLPSTYQSATMLYDKLLDATRAHWFSHVVLAHPSSNPHALMSHIQLLLTAGPPSAPPSPSPAPTLSPTAALPTAPAFHADGAPSDSLRLGDSFIVEDEDHPDDSAQAWYVFKRFRANTARPYKTESTPFRRPPPSAANPCHNCGAADHFPRTCPSPRRNPHAPLTHAHVTFPHAMSDTLPSFTPPPHAAAAASLPPPPPIPPQLPITRPPVPDYDNAWFVPHTPLSTVYTVSEPTIRTAITDTKTPGDIVGDAWLCRHPQLLTGPARPATTIYVLVHDVPTSAGRVAMRLYTRDTSNAAVELDLPDVHILRHDAVPLLFGLQSHKRFNFVVDTARDTIYAGAPRTQILCLQRRGHLTFAPPPPPPPTSIYYTGNEMRLAHRQFGHARVAAIVRAFPRDTFSPADIDHLKTGTDTCVPCQQHSHLRRRPRHALPNPPYALNCILTMDVFQLTPDLPEVADIPDLYTDFGQGRFVSSMRGKVLFAIVYLYWFSIWGPSEQFLTDRGSENENNAFVAALHSMGLHWRPIPTEAP
eukprot:TRINITY_DN6087_c0_g1_i1.p1 TRINITY_DN6087_c0_g1~~TRINITY_DN6087_c0_g1_i1.p1  ORF type:complete len:542 (+),score=70.37 TRINITY_DN6087_c0_g1_i1:436-2061(+)